VDERQEKEGSVHRSRGRGLGPFEAEAGEAGEGWGSGVRRCVEGKTEEGFGDVDRHGTDAAALGCSNSSEWCMPHRRGGRGLQTGEDGGVHDTERRD
jgi:hypothetical protein